MHEDYHHAKARVLDFEFNGKAVAIDHPSIMTIDVAPEISESLLELGLNVTKGSFGKPYEVKKPHKGIQPSATNASLPFYRDKEIVIVDLATPISIPENPDYLKNSEQVTYYAPREDWINDSRPVAIYNRRVESEQILQNGGFFILITAPRLTRKISFHPPPLIGSSTELFNPTTVDNWEILNVLSPRNLEVKKQTGTEFSTLKNQKHILTPLLKKYSIGTYSTTLSKKDSSMLFLPLLQSKFGECVSCLIEIEKNKPSILIVPNMSEIQNFFKELFSDSLPELLPGLFKTNEKLAWLFSKDYELPEVLSCNTKKEILESKYQRDLEIIDSEIEEHRRVSGFLHDLISKDSDCLVDAVKSTLESLGFQNVINMDDKYNPPEEDLQIELEPPLLVVEVKGLHGFPSDDDVRQVTKYVTRRMRQKDRTDVHGLVFINTQRLLPPQERNHKNAFTVTQIQDAVDQEYTLSTTWELYQILKNAKRFNWSQKDISDMFLVSGRIPKLPKRYIYIGKVNTTFKESRAISLDISNQSLRIGDKIAILSNDEILEQKITSIQIDNAPIEIAEKNSRVGIQSDFQVKSGSEVFLSLTCNQNLDPSQVDD